MVHAPRLLPPAQDPKGLLDAEDIDSAEGGGQEEMQRTSYEPGNGGLRWGRCSAQDWGLGRGPGAVAMDATVHRGQGCSILSVSCGDRAVIDILL